MTNLFPFVFIDSYLLSRFWGYSKLTTYLRFKGSEAKCDGGIITVSASFNFRTTGPYKFNSNQLKVHLFTFDLVNRRWQLKENLIQQAITADTPQNVWNNFRFETDFGCRDYYGVSLFFVVRLSIHSF